MSARPRRPHIIFFGLALIATAPACQPSFGYLEVTVRSSPPLPVSVRDHRFELPVGVAVLIAVEPMSDNINDYVETDRLDLSPSDAAILDIEPGPESRTFVLIGVNPGETCVDVYINGRAEQCIPAVVNAPL